MAKNKRPQDRQEKHDEIVSVARTLFLQDGFDAVSMSRLATAAGVAPNTIYWYFKDKDEVLAVVLTEVLNMHFQAYLSTSLPQLIDKLLWLVARLQDASLLISTVHARLQLSPSISAWHDNFHRMSEALIRHELLMQGFLETELDALTKIFIFTVEGLLMHQCDEEMSCRIFEVLLRQLKLNV